MMSESTTPPLSSSSSDDSKKRTRVTPSQLTILEETFNVSATPDSKMRKQLAFKLQMPERSIQIWFQNRRAKVKMLQRRVLLRQEQEAARARLCAEVGSAGNMPPPPNPYWFTQQQQQMQIYRKLGQQQQQQHRAWSTDMIPPPSHHHHSHYNPHSIPPPPPPPSSMFHYSHHHHEQPPPSISITGPNELDEDIYSLTISPSPTPQSFIGSASVATISQRRMESERIHHHHQQTTQNDTLTTTGLITATAVTVGSWHRMKISQQDLMCTYNAANDRAFSWHIRDSNYHFKMMISFDSIASIELVVLDDHISAQIDMDLIEPPIFFMESGGNWVQCSDFTEGMQASIVLRHTVRGLAVDLTQELLNVAGVDEHLCQITRFPASSSAGISGLDYSQQATIDQSLLFSHNQQPQQQQNWRHQSLPLSAAWVPPPYPL